jgi:hypothetical protein
MDEASILSDLKKSIKIKQIKPRNDEEREKQYLKRILQARMCSIHPNDDSYFLLEQKLKKIKYKHQNG